MTNAAVKLELAEACYTHGRALFAGIAWDRLEFEQTCLRRWSSLDGGELAGRLALGRGLAEEYLIAACLAQRPGALAALERQYLSRLLTRVRQICRHPDVADDVLQLLREKLLLPPQRRLASYENRGQLAAWLSVIAVRTALDVSRSRKLQQGRLAELDETLINLATGPETRYLRREAQVALRQALRQAVQRLPEKQRFALKMHWVAGWSIDQIARVLAVHRATAARWLVAGREQVEVDVRTGLSEQLGLSDREVTCLVGQIRSRLDIQLSRLFRTAADADVARGHVAS